jgi:hypothetical protein
MLELLGPGYGNGGLGGVDARCMYRCNGSSDPSLSMNGSGKSGVLEVTIHNTR